MAGNAGSGFSAQGGCLNIPKERVTLRQTKLLALRCGNGEIAIVWFDCQVSPPCAALGFGLLLRWLGVLK